MSESGEFAVALLVAPLAGAVLAAAGVVAGAAWLARKMLSSSSPVFSARELESRILGELGRDLTPFQLQTGSTLDVSTEGPLLGASRLLKTIRAEEVLAATALANCGAELQTLESELAARQGGQTANSITSIELERRSANLLRATFQILSVAEAQTIASAVVECLSEMGYTTELSIGGGAVGIWATSADRAVALTVNKGEMKIDLGGCESNSCRRESDALVAKLRARGVIVSGFVPNFHGRTEGGSLITDASRESRLMKIEKADALLRIAQTSAQVRPDQTIQSVSASPVVETDNRAVSAWLATQNGLSI